MVSNAPLATVDPATVDALLDVSLAALRWRLERRSWQRASPAEVATARFRLAQRERELEETLDRLESEVLDG